MANIKQFCIRVESDIFLIKISIKTNWKNNWKSSCCEFVSEKQSGWENA